MVILALSNIYIPKISATESYFTAEGGTLAIDEIEPDRRTIWIKLKAAREMTIHSLEGYFTPVDNDEELEYGFGEISAMPVKVELAVIDEDTETGKQVRDITMDAYAIAGHDISVYKYITGNGTLDVPDIIVGVGGYFWSPVVDSSRGAYSLAVGGNGGMDLSSGDFRYAGLSVRCVAR